MTASTHHSTVWCWPSSLRGDKLTQRVWQEILAGGYVAQALVAPGGRVIQNEEPVQVLKFDLRDYAYDGRVQWVAARLYQGQTKNFRTPGGSFAPVYQWPVEGLAGWKSKGCVPAPRVFLLGESGVLPLAHQRYVALVRGEATAPEFAGHRFILVDWRVQHAANE